MRESILSPAKRDLFFLVLMGLFSTTFLFAQSISPKKLPFTNICAGEGFNQYEANFVYSGFPALTTFEVELSDNMGSFTTPVATTILSTVDISSTEKKITFAIPSTLIGSEIYSLRVKSSTGVVSSKFVNFASNSSFPVYFKPFESSFYINGREASAAICIGGSTTISIDNPTPDIKNSSPANYPDLKYKWYKGTALIAGETGPSLVVNSVGEYYAVIDYGLCSDANFSSNRVTVIEAAGASVSISSSEGNPFCPTNTFTVLSTVASANSYQWYNNNVAISGATTNQYQANQAGVYSVAVDFGGCTTTASIDLAVNKISGTVEPSQSLIQEGETKTITVTTDADSPSYQWYLNNLLISGATGSTYGATEVGDYKVLITQNLGCAISKEVPFKIASGLDPNATKIPNLISPNNDGINDTWVIPQEYAGGTNTEVIVMSAQGEVVLKTNNYLNNWPETQIDFTNTNPVYYYIITSQNQKVKKGSITVVK